VAPAITSEWLPRIGTTAALTVPTEQDFQSVRPAKIVHGDTIQPGLPGIKE
jgi:hypothetical protein